MLVLLCQQVKDWKAIVKHLQWLIQSVIFCPTAFIKLRWGFLKKGKKHNLKILIVVYCIYQDGTCNIGNECYLNGDKIKNGSNLYCDSSINQFGWTEKIDSTTLVSSVEIVSGSMQCSVTCVGACSNAAPTVAWHIAANNQTLQTSTAIYKSDISKFVSILSESIWLQNINNEVHIFLSHLPLVTF